jgi:hypothetical protein
MGLEDKLKALVSERDEQAKRARAEQAAEQEKSRQQQNEWSAYINGFIAPKFEEAAQMIRRTSLDARTSANSYSGGGLAGYSLIISTKQARPATATISILHQLGTTNGSYTVRVPFNPALDTSGLVMCGDESEELIEKLVLPLVEVML